MLDDDGHLLDRLNGDSKRFRCDARVFQCHVEARLDFVRLGCICGHRGVELHAATHFGEPPRARVCGVRLRCHHFYVFKRNLGNGRHARSVRRGVVGVDVSLYDRAKKHQLLARRESIVSPVPTCSYEHARDHRTDGR